MIRYNEELVSATDQWGDTLATYDDGMGPLWLYRDASGCRTAVVRALGWEDAYELVTDYILPTTGEDSLPEAYGYYIHRRGARRWDVEKPDETLLGSYPSEDEAQQAALDHAGKTYADLVEGYRYQPNATGTGIVEYDINGEFLEPLSERLLEEIGVQLVIREI